MDEVIHFQQSMFLMCSAVLCYEGFFSYFGCGSVMVISRVSHIHSYIFKKSPILHGLYKVSTNNNCNIILYKKSLINFGHSCIKFRFLLIGFFFSSFFFEVAANWLLYGASKIFVCYSLWWSVGRSRMSFVY